MATPPGSPPRPVLYTPSTSARNKMRIQSTASWALFNPFLLNEVNGNLPARGILREDHPPSHQETGPSRSPAGWWACEHQGGHRPPEHPGPRTHSLVQACRAQRLGGSTCILWVQSHPEHLKKKQERRGDSIKAKTRPQPSLRTRSPREGELPTAPRVSASVPLPLTCLRLTPTLNSAFALLVRFHFWLFRE